MEEKTAAVQLASPAALVELKMVAGQPVSPAEEKMAADQPASQAEEKSVVDQLESPVSLAASQQAAEGLEAPHVARRLAGRGHGTKRTCPSVEKKCPAARGRGRLRLAREFGRVAHIYR